MPVYVEGNISNTPVGSIVKLDVPISDSYAQNLTLEMGIVIGVHIDPLEKKSTLIDVLMSDFRTVVRKSAYWKRPMNVQDQDTISVYDQYMSYCIRVPNIHDSEEHISDSEWIDGTLESITNSPGDVVYAPITMTSYPVGDFDHPARIFLVPFTILSVPSDGRHVEGYYHTDMYQHVRVEKFYYRKIRNNFARIRERLIASAKDNIGLITDSDGES